MIKGLCTSNSAFGWIWFDHVWLDLTQSTIRTSGYNQVCRVRLRYTFPKFFNEVVVPTPLLLFFGLGTICLRGQSGSRSTRMWRTGALNMGDLPWAESHKTINKGRFWLGHRLKHAVLLVKGPKTSKHVATSLLLHLGCTEYFVLQDAPTKLTPKGPQLVICNVLLCSLQVQGLKLGWKLKVAQFVWHAGWQTVPCNNRKFFTA